MTNVKRLLVFIFLFNKIAFFSQDIELYQQFNGRYDFLMFGNTLNESENPDDCTILSSSSASFGLNVDQTIVAAYLYWAGSGTGDFEITLNEEPFQADRTFPLTLSTVFSGEQPFFAAFTDITSFLQNETDTNFTLSNLDLSAAILENNYCTNNTNFGGWSVLVIFEDSSFPLNQISVFDGLQAVSQVQNELSLVLDNLNVLDNIDSKIGFLTWEGDALLANNETLRINNNIIGNPPLNPINNAFNGTNSYTNSDTLYNMDMDFYEVENNINIGDTQATIQLTSSQDFVMVNNVVTKFNSQLPDASIQLVDTSSLCGETSATISFVVTNNNATDEIPTNTSIQIYANNTLIETIYTDSPIPINGQIPFTISVPIETTITPFSILVDQENSLVEINEYNNSITFNIPFLDLPEVVMVPDLESCFVNGIASFDLAPTETYLIENSNLNTSITLYDSAQTLSNMTSAIDTSTPYETPMDSTTIHILYQHDINDCTNTNTFKLLAKECSLDIPNGFTPNNDGINDFFEVIQYLPIENYHLIIFNRWGNEIFATRDPNILWDGTYNGKKCPAGTYFYILEILDPSFATKQTGWVYLTY